MQMVVLRGGSYAMAGEGCKGNGVNDSTVWSDAIECPVRAPIIKVRTIVQRRETRQYVQYTQRSSF